MNITVDEAREMSDAQLGRKVRAYLEEKHAQEEEPPYRPTIYREMEIKDLPDGGKAAKAEPFQDYPEHDIFEVDAAGFGMVMTTTRLLRDVTEQCGLPFTPVPGFGEDMAFCLRARAIGYPLWCDSSIRGLHIGTTLFGEEDWMKSTEKEERG